MFPKLECIYDYAVTFGNRTFGIGTDLLGLEMSSNFHHYLALQTVKMQYEQITGQLIPRVGVERKKIELVGRRLNM